VSGPWGCHRALVVAVALLPLLVLGLVGVWVATRPAMTPLLATVRLSLDPRAEVDAALDAPRHRLFLVNAGVVWTIDTRRGALIRVAHSGTAYAQALDGPAPALDERTGQLYVPNLVDDTLAVLDAATGRVRCVLSIGRQPDEVAVDDRAGRVFVGSTADWTLTTLDARTNHTLSTRPFAAGDLPGQLVVDPQDGRGIAAGYGGQVTLFDTRTGRPLRGVVPAHGHLIEGLAVDVPARRMLGLIENEPVVVLLDARTAAPLRVVPVGPDPAALALDPSTDRAFVADGGDGTVYALGLPGGRVLRRVPVGPAPLLAVDARRGRVIVASATGVSLLDAGNGRLLRRWLVALTPAALLVDTRSGHILLVDTRSGHILLVESGRTAHRPAPWTWLLRPLRRWFPSLPPLRASLHVIPARLLVVDEDRL